MHKPLTYKYTVLLLLGVALLTALLLWTAPDPETALTPPVIMQVEVVTVARLDIQPQARLSGVLQPARRAALRFEVDGVVQERLVEPGRVVAEGEALLALDRRDYQDTVTEARARLAQEQAAIERDRSVAKLAARNTQLQVDEVTRIERLGTQSLSSQSALDSARQKLLSLQAEQARLTYSVATADARVAVLEAALRRAERNLARAQLTAPFAGLVNGVQVDVGDFVARNQPVLELVGGGMLKVYLEVSGVVANHLRMGQPVSVGLDGQTFDGEIIALQPTAKVDTATHGVEIRMVDPGILPGALVDVILPLEPLPGALVVPVTALAREDGDVFVFVVQDHVLHRRQVMAGYRDGEQQVINTGLKEGESVVSRGAAALSDGQTVKF